MKSVLYIHGRGGSAEESEHYRPLFPGCDVLGLDYREAFPRETGEELRAEAERLSRKYEQVILIANSIGAFFAMHGAVDKLVQRAYFISPIVDMEGLITGMMQRAGVTEDELRARGSIRTAWGEELSWAYLSCVRSHPAEWTAPTQILYGSGDVLTPIETIRRFAEKHNAGLTVMEGGEHWFHTEEQLRFLDEWIRKSEASLRRAAGEKVLASGAAACYDAPEREDTADRKEVTP